MMVPESHCKFHLHELAIQIYTHLFLCYRKFDGFSENSKILIEDFLKNPFFVDKERKNIESISKATSIQLVLFENKKEHHASNKITV